ncbi:hypothetical protein PFISCL1PPCAC_16938, partial [Pristionchus fissidentatus]
DTLKGGPSGSNKPGEFVSSEIQPGSLIRVTQGPHAGAFANVHSRGPKNCALVLTGGETIFVPISLCRISSKEEFQEVSRRRQDQERIEMENEEKRRVREEAWPIEYCRVTLHSVVYQKGRFNDVRMNVERVVDKYNVTLTDENGMLHENELAQDSYSEGEGKEDDRADGQPARS